MRAAASTLTVRGTPDQLALTSWLVHELDQPVTAQPSVPLAVTTPPPRQFLVAGGSDDIIRVFHLVNTPPAPSQAIQEILTTLRTVAGVEKVSDYTPLTDLVVRGSKAQIALSEYLIKAVDVRSGSVTTSPEFQYTTSDGLDQSVRVFYLAHTSTAQGILEILAALVTVADIQKIFVVIPAGALAIRGSASDIATSGWLIQALDIPATPATSPSARVREYHIPGTVSGGNVISVFYPDTTTRVQFRTLGLVRNKLQIRKAFSLISPPALIVRGSPDQIAKARQLIQDGAGAAKTAR
jgi:type II secretory pathway component GspD/PulD (secretin)